MFYLETERLVITEFNPGMAQAVHENSLDEDNRRFVPDEVFETPGEAAEAIAFLMEQYGGSSGPLVYPVLLKSGEVIGHVQAVPVEGGWEAGYHIAFPHTGKGYATEALRAFLPVIMGRLGLTEMKGICLADNAGSRRVMEKCGFVPEFRGTGNYQGADREICVYTFTLPWA